MTTPIIKIKVFPKTSIKGKMDVRFPAKVETENFLTVTRANGVYTLGIDYTLLTDVPIINPSTAMVVVLDKSAGIYKLQSVAELATDLPANSVTYSQIQQVGANKLLGNPTGSTANVSEISIGTGIATALGVNVGTAGAPVINGGVLGTPSSGTATNLTGLPISTGVSGLATGVATFLATPSSANLRAAITDEVGTGAAYFVGGALGTPASGTATNLTGLPLSTGISGAGTGVLTALGVNVGTAGSIVVNGGALGTPSSGTLTSATGLPISTGVSGLGTGIATALAVNVGTAGSPVVNGGALGTPASGVGTNLTGTASGLTAGHVTTNANLTGDVTSVGNATTLTNAPVIAKVLTGYVNGAGTVSATDSILTALQKIDGNDALKAPLASPSLTGVPTAPTASLGTNTTQLATTAFVLANGGAGSFTGPGSSVTNNVISFAGTTGAVGKDSGIPAAALPTMPGQIPSVVPTTATVTITIASPGVVTWTAHGLSRGTPIAMATTGALPSPLTATASISTGSNLPGGAIYYAIPTGANTLNLATSYALALAGTAINTTGTQSGTQTAVANGVLIPGMKGYIYEAELGSGSAIGLLFQVSTQLLTLTLPAGVYDIQGQADCVTAGGALVSEYHSSISTSAAPTIISFPNEGGNDGAHIIYRASQTNVLKPGPKRFFLTASTTIYLQVYSTFGTDTGGSNGSGSQTMYGYLRATVV